MPSPNRLPRALLLGALLLATACSKVPLGVYRVDVQQGNVLNEDMLAQLAPGMEKRKVRFLLGTPMLIDTFNQDRWDYIYTYSQGGDTIEQRQITLFFEEDRLERIEGDVHQGAGRREVTRGETLVLVPEEKNTGGILETLESGLDLLRPDPEAESEGAASSAESQPAGVTETSDDGSPSETVARADADAGPPGESGDGTIEDGQEGWLANMLQYLQPRTPSSPEDDPGLPSGTAQDRQ